MNPMSGELIFAGVVISLIISGLQKVFGSGEYSTLAITVILAVVGAGGSMLLQKYGFTESFIQLLTTASTFYALIIRRFDSDAAIGSALASYSTRNRGLLASVAGAIVQ